MKQDLTEIIKTLMNSDYDEKDIALAILSLKERWPNLTESEQQEIDAAAFSIYSLGYDFDPTTEFFPDCLYLNNEDDYSIDENDFEEENKNYSSSHSYESVNTSTQQEETGFQKFFSRFKRKN